MTDNTNDSDGIFEAANKLGGKLHTEFEARRAAEEAAKQKQRELKHQEELKVRKKTEGLL